jgi:hypothetical protein
MRAGKATVSNSCCRNGSIAARQSLPGYDLFIELEGARKLLRVVPRRLSTGTVDSSVEAIRRLGATLSADQAHGSQLTLWLAERKRRPNESNSKDSNFLLLASETRAVAPTALPDRHGRFGSNDH